MALLKKENVKILVNVVCCFIILNLTFEFYQLSSKLLTFQKKGRNGNKNGIIKTILTLEIAFELI